MPRRGGTTYEASRQRPVNANAGQAVLPHGVEALANNPAQLGGFNRDLSAGLSRGEEVGLRGMAGTQALFDVSLFHLDTEKDFDRYRVASRPLETFYRNVGSSRRFGGEVYVSWTPVRPLALQVAYTYSHFQYTNTTSAYGDISGHWLPNSPEHQLVADAQRAGSQVDVLPRRGGVNDARDGGASGGGGACVIRAGSTHRDRAGGRVAALGGVGVHDPNRRAPGRRELRPLFGLHA